MGLFYWMRKKGKGDGGSPEQAGSPVGEMPWDSHPSIYEFLKQAEPGSGDRSELKLPDNEKFEGDGKLSFAAGAMDGIASHHMGSDPDTEAVGRAAKLLATYCSQPTAANKLELYRWVLDNNVLSLLDPLLERLSEMKVDVRRLYELAYSLTTESPDREPVKLGIAVLGRFENPENNSIFITLGSHDEFTLYSAVAIANQSEDPERDLWALAKRVHGWGRVQLVERISETEDPEIKEWLVLEGYKNSIMYEYLAYPCAMGGELHLLLAEDQVDDELIASASDIIEALINGGPAADISHYEYGQQVLKDYLRLVQNGEQPLIALLTVMSIQRYLKSLPERDETSEYEQWDEGDRLLALETCKSITQQPHWETLVKSGLSDRDSMVFGQASHAAKALGISTWDDHWRRLQEDPEDSGRWYNIMQVVDDPTIGQVVAYAERVIPLGKIATGIGDEMGLGNEFKHHSCLDYVLQDLRRFAGKGHDLVRTGLKSPVIRNRNMALMALKEWDDASWPQDIKPSLYEIAKQDPNESTRELAEELLQRLDGSE